MSPLNDPTAAIRAGVEAGLKAAGEHIADVAAAQAPMDTGELRESVTVEVDGSRVEVAFTAEHAIYMHEGMNYEHTTGGPKFLEKALHSEADVAARLIGDEIRKKLGG